jgi:glycosyltransferase involved in cell wall biosynthesis
VRLSVVVPAYNEESTIRAILERVRAVEVVSQIVVVNDCSTDGTRAELAKIDWPNVTVIHHEVNQGKGAAIRTGIAAVTCDLVVIQDADLEYDPNEFPRLMEPILDGRTDAAYGSRFLGRPRKMTLVQWVGNRFLTLTTNALYGATLTDMETCYKMMPARIARELDLHCRRYDVEPEITAKLLRAGYRILEVPISYEGRDHAAGKKIRWTDGFPAIQALVQNRFGSSPLPPRQG